MPAGLRVAGLPGLCAAVLSLNTPGLVLAATCWQLLSAHQGAAVVQKLMLAMRYGAAAMLASALCALCAPLLPGAGPSYSPVALGLATALFVAGGVAVSPPLPIRPMLWDWDSPVWWRTLLSRRSARKRRGAQSRRAGYPPSWAWPCTSLPAWRSYDNETAMTTRAASAPAVAGAGPAADLRDRRTNSVGQQP
jgi:hypothetical protein